MEENYWIDKYLLNQIWIKILSIGEALYSGYELFFIFNNVISHAIYVKKTLQVAYMNKRSRGQ